VTTEKHDSRASVGAAGLAQCGSVDRASHRGTTEVQLRVVTPRDRCNFDESRYDLVSSTNRVAVGLLGDVEDEVEVAVSAAVGVADVHEAVDGFSVDGGCGVCRCGSPGPRSATTAT
jgi:hypothetical protein